MPSSFRGLRHLPLEIEANVLASYVTASLALLVLVYDLVIPCLSCTALAKVT